MGRKHLRWERGPMDAESSCFVRWCLYLIVVSGERKLQTLSAGALAGKCRAPSSGRDLSGVIEHLCEIEGLTMYDLPYRSASFFTAFRSSPTCSAFLYRWDRSSPNARAVFEI